MSLKTKIGGVKEEKRNNTSRFIDEGETLLRSLTCECFRAFITNQGHCQESFALDYNRTMGVEVILRKGGEKNTYHELAYESRTKVGRITLTTKEKIIEKMGGGPQVHYLLATVRYRLIPSDDSQKRAEERNFEVCIVLIAQKLPKNCPKGGT